MKIEIENLIDKFLKEIRTMSYFSKIEFITLFGSYLSEYHFEDSER